MATTETLASIIVYARVSTNRQEREETIETQLSECRRWAAQRGLPIIATFRDEGVSGSVPLADRPGGQGLLGCLDKGSTVLVYRLDRLAREVEGGLVARRRIRQTGAGLQSTRETWDDTPQGNLMYQMFMAFGEYERASITERTTHGRRRKVREGHYMTGGRAGQDAPYGYQWAVTVQGERTGQLVIDEAKAVVVREMYRLLLAGLSCWEIKKTTGDARSVNAICKLLKLERFTGQTRYGPEVMTCPAIISWETFEQAQAALSSHLKRPSNVKGNYLLGNSLMRCRTCGSIYSGWTQHWTMQNGTKRERVIYACLNRRRHGPKAGHADAPGWWLPADAIEPKIQELVYDMLYRPERVAQRCELHIQQATQHDETAVKRLDRQLMELAKQRQKVLDWGLSGAIEEADMVGKLETLACDRKRLEGERERLLAAQAEANRLTEGASWLAQVLRGEDATTWLLYAALRKESPRKPEPGSRVAALLEFAAVTDWPAAIHRVAQTIWIEPDGQPTIEGVTASPPSRRQAGHNTYSYTLKIAA